jgi:hypothetical protein
MRACDNCSSVVNAHPVDVTYGNQQAEDVEFDLCEKCRVEFHQEVKAWTVQKLRRKVENEVAEAAKRGFNS